MSKDTPASGGLTPVERKSIVDAVLRAMNEEFTFDVTVEDKQLAIAVEQRVKLEVQKLEARLAALESASKQATPPKARGRVSRKNQDTVADPEGTAPPEAESSSEEAL